MKHLGNLRSPYCIEGVSVKLQLSHLSGSPRHEPADGPGQQPQLAALSQAENPHGRDGPPPPHCLSSPRMAASPQKCVSFSDVPLPRYFYLRLYNADSLRQRFCLFNVFHDFPPGLSVCCPRGTAGDSVSYRFRGDSSMSFQEIFAFPALFLGGEQAWHPSHSTCDCLVIATVTALS